jgi:hypothetical protein
VSDHPNLATALAAFQRELPAVSKTATGQVPGKRSYKYADLADLSATVLPLLGKHGLSWTTMPTVEDGAFGLRYELLHTSGESRSGFYPLPTGSAWEIGSALTYGRRYCLSAVTGVAADEDDDGHAAQQVKPHLAAPLARKVTVKEARADLELAIKTNGWTKSVVLDLFADRYPAGLDAERDPARIEKFRQWLFSQPQESLVARPEETEKAEQPAATNGAAS